MTFSEPDVLRVLSWLFFSNRLWMDVKVVSSYSRYDFAWRTWKLSTERDKNWLLLCVKPQQNKNQLRPQEFHRRQLDSFCLESAINILVRWNVNISYFNLSVLIRFKNKVYSCHPYDIPWTWLTTNLSLKYSGNRRPVAVTQSMHVVFELQCAPNNVDSVVKYVIEYFGCGCPFYAQH